MEKRLPALAALLLVFALMATGCAKSNPPAEPSKTPEGSSPAQNSPEPTQPTQKKLKVALMLAGSLGDMSFLDSANDGMKAVADKGLAEVKVIEMGPDASKYEPNFLDASEGDYDIIIGSGWQTQEPIQNVAPQFPDKKYILFDAALDYTAGDYKNVYCITYKQNEGSFLAGVLAGKMTQTGKIGFLGGMQGAVIDDFMIGYIEGAKYANPDIKVLTGYVNSYVDSAKCKEMSLSQYNQGGADFVFTAAGAAGMGTLDAAKEVGKWAIGVDSDQAMLFHTSDPAKAEHTPASVMKRVDNSLIRAFDLISKDQLPWGEAESLGLAEGAVGLSDNQYYEKLVSQELRGEIKQVSDKIISGEIKVETAFGKDNAAISAIVNSVKA